MSLQVVLGIIAPIFTFLGVLVATLINKSIEDNKTAQTAFMEELKILLQEKNAEIEKLEREVEKLNGEIEKLREMLNRRV